MRSALAMSAAAGVCLVVWLATLPTQTVYGIEDVAERLERVNSLYVKGYAYEPVPGVPGGQTRVPTAIYVERPDRYWQLGHSSVRSRDSLEIQVHQSASDGRRYLRRNDTRKTATVGAEVPAAATLRVEFMLQHQFFGQLFGGRPEQFSKTASTRIDGNTIDVYERVFRIREVREEATLRFEVWLDRATGIPTRGLVFQQSGDGEQLMLEFDEIAADVPPPAGALELEPPDGYHVVQQDRRLGDQAMLAADSRSGAHLRMLAALEVDEHATLVCWAAYRVDADEVREQQVRLAAGQPLELDGLSVVAGELPYRAVHLAAHRSADGYHWRWTLLLPQPEQNAEAAGGQPPVVRWHTDDWDLSATLTPIRLPAERLELLLREIQQQLADDRELQPFGVGQLQQLLREQLRPTR